MQKGMKAVERKTPSKQHLEALYDLINTLMPQADVYYTEEELAKIPTMEGIELI